MIKDNQKSLNHVQVLLDAVVTAAAYVLAWFITMKIEVEGDLFRVILRWKLKDGSEEPEETIQEGSVQEKLVQEEPEADIEESKSGDQE